MYLPIFFKRDGTSRHYVVRSFVRQCVREVSWSTFVFLSDPCKCSLFYINYFCVLGLKSFIRLEFMWLVKERGREMVGGENYLGRLGNTVFSPTFPRSFDNPLNNSKSLKPKSLE